MYLAKKFEFDASEIAHIVQSQLVGKDLKVSRIDMLGEQKKGSIILCYPKFKDRLNSIEEPCLVFCTEETIIEKENLSFIICANPKFSFFDFINNYVVTETSYWVDNTISLESNLFPDVDFGYNVKVGYNVCISPGSKIGNNSIIGNNVVIRSNSEIGDNAIIKDNTVIGSEGFGFVKSEKKTIHVPQLGSIRIGNNVIIGSNCAVEKPALGSTVISDGVKIDDLIQIGHNQFIGENTMIATGFKGIGGCKIGKNCFIGMGVTIVSKKATVGNDCFIGAGTILVQPVKDKTTVYNKVELISEENTHLDEMLSTPKSTS